MRGGIEKQTDSCLHWALYFSLMLLSSSLIATEGEACYVLYVWPVTRNQKTNQISPTRFSHQYPPPGFHSPPFFITLPFSFLSPFPTVPETRCRRSTGKWNPRGHDNMIQSNG